MPALELDIVAKNRTPSASPAALGDFTTTDGGAVSAETILHNSFVTLYCLDDETRRAVFVETRESVDLYAPPFLYQAQYEHAQKLLVVPYAELNALAQKVPRPDLILLYSLGRCGSTLLSQAFNELPTVLSLSEPDVFFNVTGLRDGEGQRDAELATLLESSLKLLCKPGPAKTPRRWAVKFRGFSIEIADLVQRVVPNAKTLFLYRNAESWARSMARLTRLVERGGLEKEPGRTTLNGYPIERYVSYVRQLEPWPEALSRLESSALVWLSLMNRALEHARAGLPFVALRYEDLVRQPEVMLERLFAYCSLDRRGVPLAKRAFARDSQEGTRFAGRANRDAALELSTEHLEQVRAVLKLHPEINSPDYSLPNTLAP